MLREDGFLGPYGRILVTDDTQHMCWDLVFLNIQLTGPFWISDTENVKHRHDVLTVNNKPLKWNRNKLIERLHSSGVVEKGSKADNDSKAKENDTAVEENENYNKEGWVGEPKGKLQVLWQ